MSSLPDICCRCPRDLLVVDGGDLDDHRVERLIRWHGAVGDEVTLG